MSSEIVNTSETETSDLKGKALFIGLAIVVLLFTCIYIFSIIYTGTAVYGGAEKNWFEMATMYPGFPLLVLTSLYGIIKGYEYMYWKLDTI